MKWPKLLTNLFQVEKKPEPKKSGRPVGSKSKLPYGQVKIQKEIERDQFKPMNKTHKFPRRYKHKIAKYLAQCEDNREVLNLILAETGIQLDLGTIYEFKKSKKWSAVIERERETFLHNIAEIPGYHDKVRLMRSDAIYKYAIAHDDPELALKATEQQRKELKETGQKSAPVNLIFQQYNNMSDEELQDRYNEALGKIESKRKVKVIEQRSENGTS